MDVEASFIGDSSEPTVRAATVIRNAFERMERSEKGEAAAAEPDGREVSSHSVFKFDFDDDDRPDLYMDNDQTVVVREVSSAEGIDAARAEAVEWVGEPDTETDISHIPGVYQTGMIEVVTGVARLWNHETLSWWIPGGGDGPAMVVRNYPPRVDEATPSFNVLELPPNERLRIYQEFLNSPGVEEELRRAKRWRFRG